MSTSSLFGTISAAQLPAGSSWDAFLTVDGVPGGSTDRRHPDAVELLDWTFGVAVSGPHGRSAGAGRPEPKDLVVVARTGKASPPLVRACATGRHIATAVLAVRNPGRTTDLLTVSLEDVLVAGYDAAADPRDARPLDVVRLTYRKATVTVRDEDARGGSLPPVTAEVGARGGRDR